MEVSLYPAQIAGKKLGKEERQTVCKGPIGSTNHSEEKHF